MLHQIGAGTLGPVFRAHDPRSGRLVALKVFEVDLEPERAASLAAELQHLVEQGLTHSAITAPVGAGLKGGTPYLASEYVAGESLDIVAQRRRTAASGDVPWIIRRVAEAIDFGAGQGAEHGLLHPRDVLVTDSDARVTGLGVGRALERVGVRLPVRRPYSAPELVEGSSWNARSDIYALAVLAYELLLDKRFAGQAGEVAIHPEDLPDVDVAAVGDVLSRSLATEPERRHRTAKAFVRDLDAALSGTSKTGSSLPLLDSLEAAPPSVRSWIHPPPTGVDETEDAGSVPLQDASEQQIPLGVDFEDDRGAVSEDGMFGTQRDADVQSKRRGLALVLGAVLVAAAAVLGYMAVARSGWWTAQEQSETGAPFTETTVAPPAASQPAAPPAAPAETSPPKTTPPTPPTSPAAADASPTKPPAPSVASSSPSRAKPAATKIPATPQAKAAPAEATGRMLIRSTPAGAQVAVNGVASGVTPLVLRNLPFGSYTIRITLPGFAPSDHRLVLTADRQAQSVEVALQEGGVPATPTGQGPPSQAPLGALVVESRPAGATVYFNNKPLGQTPLAVTDLPVGSGTVRLELAGYRSWSSTVQVTAGTRERVAASLERVTPQ
ncbi:MAG: PEGA domain-containing protein [Vicinamibacterales bacterium]